MDIGCGAKKRGTIGLDSQKDSCDVIGDAEHLPFSSEIFDGIYIINVLEHLNNPFNCLREALRVAKPNCKIRISIPVNASYTPYLLRLYILAFPFGPLYALKLCLDIQKSKKLKGALHVNRIQPRHVFSLIGKGKITKEINFHPWFHGPQGKLLAKIFGTAPKISAGMDAWVIDCHLSSSKETLEPNRPKL